MNRKGIQFYSDFIDALLKSNITPIVTLHHWDLPQVRLCRFRGPRGKLSSAGGSLLWALGLAKVGAKPGVKALGKALAQDKKMAGSGEEISLLTHGREVTLIYLMFVISGKGRLMFPETFNLEATTQTHKEVSFE